jgi:hypothetical protein
MDQVTPGQVEHGGLYSSSPLLPSLEGRRRKGSVGTVSSKAGDTRNGQPQIGKSEGFLAQVTATQHPHGL